jgi:hypothetical protein
MLLIFRAKGKPTVLTNLSNVLSIADCSFSIMTVTTLASFVLFMLSTHRTVRSIIPRSSLLRDLNQTPRLKADFLASANLPIDKQLSDLELSVDSHPSLNNQMCLKDLPIYTL